MKNDSEHDMFPYACMYKGEKKIFVWQSDNSGKDTFKLDLNSRLIYGKTTNDLKQILGSEAIRVEWEEYSEINIDTFFKTLQNLRAGRSSSKHTCEALLEGWNFIEDMARTFELHQELTKLRLPPLKKVYDKLFYGNNLPSITPKGKSYSPLWLKEEISLFRKEILTLWKVLEDKLY